LVNTETKKKSRHTTDVVYLHDICRIMKKTETSKKSAPNKPGVYPSPAYPNLNKIPARKEFTYHEFKKIADRAPFTQAEWAAMLHVSERTLQRYAKNNGHFAAINAERALQIEKVLKEAKKTFGRTANFYNWLKRGPYMLEGHLSFQSLTTYSGIEKVLTQMERIQQGLFS
jgi:putative toxin-antitoxin system antitoxin component (TIGR02293 family)